MLMPFSNASPAAPSKSIPRIPRIPVFSAVPRPDPTDCATPVSHALPLLFHHCPKGSATSLSQAIFIFSQTDPAFSHSELWTISRKRCMKASIFPVMKSIAPPTACSISGMCAVSQSARERMYGASFDPTVSCTPENALCSLVRLPFRLSCIVSDIFFAAPSAFSMALVSFL